jgi:competence protein ComEC
MKISRFRLFVISLGFWIFFTARLCAGDSAIRIHFIDVGYGDAILIKLPDSSGILIDAGEQEYGQKILSYLTKTGIERLYLAVITHPHKNHFGGFDTLLDGIPIQHVLVNGAEEGEEGYTALLNRLSGSVVPVQKAERGLTIQHPSFPVTLEILHPSELSGNPNDDSIVVRLRHHKVAFLFTGDIGPAVQEQLLKQYPDLKNVQGVQIPHHGGTVSEGFARFFTNKLLAISTGKNKWGLPRQEDLKKLRGQISRTDIDGTFAFESDGRELHLLHEGKELDFLQK